jgi:hypothetical protein
LARSDPQSAAHLSRKDDLCANWDEVENIAFWDALDAVGVQMFAPLHSGGSKPTYASVLAAAKRWQNNEAIGKRFGRPLILTEAGVVNMVGALLRPYVWPERLADKNGRRAAIGSSSWVIARSSRPLAGSAKLDRSTGGSGSPIHAQRRRTGGLSRAASLLKAASKCVQK